MKRCVCGQIWNIAGSISFLKILNYTWVEPKCSRIKRLLLNCLAWYFPYIFSHANLFILITLISVAPEGSVWWDVCREMQRRGLWVVLTLAFCEFPLLLQSVGIREPGWQTPYSEMRWRLRLSDTYKMKPLWWQFGEIVGSDSDEYQETRDTCAWWNHDKETKFSYGI